MGVMACKQELEDSKPECIDDVKLFMQSTKESRYEDENGFSLEKMFGEK